MSYYNQLLYSKSKQFKQLGIGMTFQVEGSELVYMRTSVRADGSNTYVITDAALAVYTKFNDDQEVKTL